MEIRESVEVLFINTTIHIIAQSKCLEQTFTFNKKNDKEDPKFEVSDHIRISKSKIIFANSYTPSWSEEVFVIKKGKNTVPLAYVTSDLIGEKTAGKCFEKKNAKTK